MENTLHLKWHNFLLGFSLLILIDHKFWSRSFSWKTYNKQVHLFNAHADISGYKTHTHQSVDGIHENMELCPQMRGKMPVCSLQTRTTIFFFIFIIIVWVRPFFMIIFYLVLSIISFSLVVCSMSKPPTSTNKIRIV